MHKNEINISKATELPIEFYEALGKWRVEAHRILPLCLAICSLFKR